MTEPDDGSGPAPAERRLPPELDPRGPRPGAPIRSPRPTSAKSRRKRILTWVAAVVAGVVLVTSVTSWAFLQHLLNSITHTNVFGGLADRPGGGVKGDLNILLVGSDSRSGLTDAQKQQLHVGHDVGRRSDTMILLHIPRGGGRAILVSLPRDSLVTIPRHKDASGHWVPAQ